MIPQGPFSPFHQARWISLYNDGSATIPAYGICEIVDSYRPESTSAETPGGGPTVLKVRQPESDNVANFCINGPIPIAAGKPGFGTQDYPCYVAYTGSTPVFGAEWGPASGTCLMTTGKLGLIIYGDASGGLVRVARKTSGGATWIGKTAGIVKGSTGTFTVWDDSTGPWLATAETFTVRALGAAIPADKYAFAMDYRGTKIVAPWECG